MAGEPPRDAAGDAADRRRPGARPGPDAALRLRGAGGRVGPSLDHVAGRLYIAGVLPNSAANMLRWIEDPPAQAPGTAMPRTGASGQQARDIVAYLYTLR